MKTYKVEVRTWNDGPDGFGSNALRFATEDEAQKYGADLEMRWMAVAEWRVAESDEPVTALIERGEDGKLHLVHLS